MVFLDRIVVEWASTAAGLPGYTSFSFSPAQGPAMQPKVVQLFTDLGTVIPTGFTIKVPNTGSTVDEATGELVNVWSGGTTANLTMSGTGSWANAVGAQVKWETGRIADGRHIRGRTFIVPIVATAYTTTGTISSTVATTIATAAAKLYAVGGQLVVWHRPLYKGQPPDRVLERPGSNFPVISSSVPNKVVVLPSRRD